MTQKPQRPGIVLPFFDAAALKKLQKLSLPRLYLAPSFVDAVKSINSIQQNFAKILEPLQGAFARVAEQQRKAELAQAAGWLPHYTTPFELLDQAAEPAAHAAVIETYYAEHWDDVEQQIRATVDEYEFDTELKDTFSEALHAHRHGLYRSVVRLLFPEIERVASVEFYDGKSPPASLTDLRQTVAELPVGDILSFDFGLDLFKLVERHLYEKVGNDPKTRERFADDPVPNRHAALHGLVTYSTAKHSLNAVIMTDFLLHVMNRMKRYRTRAVTEGKKRHGVNP